MEFVWVIFVLKIKNLKFINLNTQKKIVKHVLAIFGTIMALKTWQQHALIQKLNHEFLPQFV